MENNIKNFDLQSIRRIDQEIQSALDRIKEKYGLGSLELGNITFSHTSFSTKLTGELPAHEEIMQDVTVEQVHYFLQFHKLPEEFLNVDFISGGKIHTIIGIEPKNPKYPVITKCRNDGKSYKFSVETIRGVLANNPLKNSLNPNLRITR